MDSTVKIIDFFETRVDNIKHKEGKKQSFAPSKDKAKK